MKGRLLAIGIGMLALSAIIGFAARGRRAEPLAVVVQPAARGQITSDVRAVGRLLSARQREIRGERTFLISKVFVKEGESVQRGQPLVLIASSQWLEELLSRYKEASIEAAVAKKALELSKELLEQKAIPSQQFEEAQIRLQKAEASVTAALREVQIARQSLSLGGEEAPPFLIRSPQDGTITRLNLKAGEILQPDPKEPLAVIADLDQIQVVAEINPLDISQVRVGQAVSFLFPFQEKQLKGRVTAIGSEVATEKSDRPQLSPASSHIIRVTCQLDRDIPIEDLKLGMVGEVRIITVVREDTLLVPLEAILSEGPTRFIYTVEAGRAIKRPIKVGISNREVAEVLEGLQPEEKVITKGQFFLKNRDPVQVVKSL